LAKEGWFELAPLRRTTSSLNRFDELMSGGQQAGLTPFCVVATFLRLPDVVCGLDAKQVVILCRFVALRSRM